MEKRKAFNLYNQISTRIGRGSGLIDIIQDWTINPSQMAVEIAAWKIILGEYVDTWVIALLVFLKKYVMKGVNYIIGNFDEKKLGFWKAQNEYHQKKNHLAPFNWETKETLNEICKKLKIKSHFKDYE